MHHHLSGALDTWGMPLDSALEDLYDDAACFDPGRRNLGLEGVSSSGIRWWWTDLLGGHGYLEGDA